MTGETDTQPSDARGRLRHAAFAGVVAFISAGCIGTNIPTADREVTATDVVFATDGSLWIGGFGQRIDITEVNSVEPRGDFFVARVLGEQTIGDRWLGTPEPERLRGLSATSDGGALTYGASLTAVCRDSAWHQRGALVELGPTAGIIQSISLSRTSMVGLADCEFPEPFHVAWAEKESTRIAFVGDWLDFDDRTTRAGLTIGSVEAGEVQWAARFDGEASLADAAPVGDETIVAINRGEGAVVSRFDGEGVPIWSVELDWTLEAVEATTNGVTVAGFCPSEEVCVARLDSTGSVDASLVFTDLEAEHVAFAAAGTVVAWDGTKIFYLGLDATLTLTDASFVEAGAEPADSVANSVAWIVEGGVAAWRVGDGCNRPSFSIAELLTADADLTAANAEEPLWLDEELVAEAWEIVPEPRGEPVEVDHCR